MGAPPLGGSGGGRVIGRPEAPRAGEPEGAEPTPRGVGEAGAPMLDTEGTSRRFVPSRAPLFRQVRLREHAYRMGVAAELERLVENLPKGRLRRRWTRKAQRLRDCGRMIAVRQCGTCGDHVAASARLLTTCQLRSCPTCARYLANDARRKAREVIEALPRVPACSFYAVHFTSKFDPADPAEFEVAALKERCQLVKKAAAYVWRRVLKHPGAGMVAALEVSPSGMAHVHALYYGRFQDVNLVRAAWLEKMPDSPQLRIDQVKNPEQAVPEVFKYMLKCASPRGRGEKGGFVDPRLAARVELALHGKRRTESYGVFRGLKAEEEPPEEAPQPMACGTCGNQDGPFFERLMPIEEWRRKKPDWRVRLSRTGAVPVPRARAPSEGGDEDGERADKHARQAHVRRAGGGRPAQREPQDGSR